MRKETAALFGMDVGDGGFDEQHQPFQVAYLFEEDKNIHAQLFPTTITENDDDMRRFEDHCEGFYSWVWADEVIEDEPDEYIEVVKERVEQKGIQELDDVLEYIKGIEN